MTFKLNREDREVSVRNLVLSIVFWALTLACILLIFLLSSIPVNESDTITDMLTATLIDSKGFNIYANDRALLSTIGHVMEFGLLTIFAYMAISSTNKISVQTSYAESPVKKLYTWGIILSIASVIGYFVSNILRKRHMEKKAEKKAMKKLQRQDK